MTDARLKQVRDRVAGLLADLADDSPGLCAALEVLSAETLFFSLVPEVWAYPLHFMEMVMDPVITVHDDRVFFEAFSQDMSSYGLVIAHRGMFRPEGDVRPGTTNVDFTRELWHALEQMRSRRGRAVFCAPRQPARPPGSTHEPCNLQCDCAQDGPPPDGCGAQV